MGKGGGGPTEKKRPPPVNQSLALILCKPMAPVSENFGNKSAVAAPTCAVAAASCLSALRISGRRLSNSEGRPTSTSGGKAGIGAVGESSSASAPGCEPN